jgi:hypothetical protein
MGPNLGAYPSAYVSCNFSPIFFVQSDTYIVIKFKLKPIFGDD